MTLLASLIIGLVAGCVARAIVPGKIGGGIIPALICGVVGSVVGGWLSTRLFGISMGSFWDVRTWVISIAGSALVLVVWGFLVGRKK
ncbi:MAG: GlsB/YeaQ/YmgE family stress response membrane protein [Propionibacteriaceae bacterium]|jgi:uncharacterized membrane protein YeaQ/YmgE (transglycosylase-associated protein family)|nr:GlsB/YeaQ/YmgE family stress response membrane protein [Propionibacteriaceae bacterium]